MKCKSHLEQYIFNDEIFYRKCTLNYIHCFFIVLIHIPTFLWFDYFTSIWKSQFLFFYYALSGTVRSAKLFQNVFFFYKLYKKGWENKLSQK